MKVRMTNHIEVKSTLPLSLGISGIIYKKGAGGAGGGGNAILGTLRAAG